MATPDDDTTTTSAVPTTQPASSPQIATFEKGLATLGELVARLESGALGLSESIAAYEQGVGILRQLHDELERADERISVLVRIDEEGRPILVAPDSESSIAESTERTPGRRRPRSKATHGRSLPGMDDETPEA